MLSYLNVTIPQGTEGSHKLESKFQELLISLRNTVTGKRFSFEYLGYEQYTYFYIVCDRSLQETVEGLVYTSYPDAEIQATKDYTLRMPTTNIGITGATFTLREPDIFPIKTYSAFEEDSMARLFSVVSKVSTGEQIWLQIIVEPQDDTSVFHIKRNLKYKISWFKKFFSIKDRIRKGGRKQINSRRADLAQKKANEDPFTVSMRCIYIAKDQSTSQQKLQAVINSVYQFNDSDSNSLHAVKSGSSVLEAYRSRTHAKTMVLGASEVATLYHFPNADKIPHLVHVLAKKSDPPQDLPKATDPGVSPFGITNYHNNFVPFGIYREDRRRHLYAVGKSGSGKSKLLELLIHNDLNTGQGLAVLDPHGDLVDNCLRYVPEHRMKDVIVFDPADTQFPIAFNPLEQVDPAYKMQLTIGIIEIFKKLFGDNWSDRLEHVLRYTLLALLDSPNTSILSILKMLTDKNYRQRIVSRIQDNVVKSFWVSEFAAWSEKFDADAITPLLNKVGQFVATDMIRNMVGQVETKFDIRDIMDNRKILFMKVSKGLLGEENSSLIGSMIITKIYQAAMSRQNIAEKDRADFYFYVDEFQNFATDTFYEILSEARKYKLMLTIAHQYMGQLSNKVRETVFGNVGSIVSFRVGAEDAVILEKEYNPIFRERDMINLGVREFYTKMSVNGQSREAFSGRTMDVPTVERDNTKEIIAMSRKAYCTPVADVKKFLDRWDEGAVDDVAAKAPVVDLPFEAPLL